MASFFLIGVLLALSAGIPAGATPPARVYDVAAARVALAFAVFLVGVVARPPPLGPGGARRPAGGADRARPDADGVRRPHVNRACCWLAGVLRGQHPTARGGCWRDTGRKRVYPLGAATGHLVGYVDPAVSVRPAGKRATTATLRRLQLGGWCRSGAPRTCPGRGSRGGGDVTVALDAGLAAALAALAEAAQVRDRRTGRPKNRGAVVVLDVATGGVLAAATLPTYDPARLTPAGLRALRANLDGDYPLVNRALDGRYPPGSTFKIVTASGLFAAGEADFTRTCGHVDTNVLWTVGETTYARRRIVDDESDRPHGLVNLSEGIAESCNIYFANAGIALGPDALRQQASRFGFARLPSAGQFAAELPDIAYGQGPMLASPLEMAGVALTVAADGRRLLPEFLKRAEPQVAATPLSPQDAARLAEMMRRVTLSGTAAGRFSTLPYAVAGKTGTAQNEEGDGMSHSWFIGFAPAQRPRVAFAVIAENGGYGASVAVPIARQVLRAAGL